MNTKKWVKGLAIIQLIAALPWHGVYLFGWYARNTNEFDPLMVGLAIEGVLFLLAPIVSLAGAFLNKGWVYYSLMVFPVLACLHGISVIPYLSHIAPIGHGRSVVLVVINGGVTYFIYRLRKGLVP